MLVGRREAGRSWLHYDLSLYQECYYVRNRVGEFRIHTNREFLGRSGYCTVPSHLVGVWVYDLGIERIALHRHQ
jgi:hypothetical protein